MTLVEVVQSLLRLFCFLLRNIMLTKCTMKMLVSALSYKIRRILFTHCIFYDIVKITTNRGEMINRENK